MNITKRILSVQSHVVSGYVGNRAAVFPLQLLGFDVDVINSLQFSNHTGYPTVKGKPLQSADLQDIYEGLESNQLLNYDYLLTGYIGSESFLKEVAILWQKISLINPQAKFLCDPVLGDNGVMYVDQTLVDIYRSKVIPLAHIITPNQFEAELLTGLKLEDEDGVCNVLKQLHSQGPEIVILTSVEFSTSKDTLHCYLSYNNHDELHITRIDVNKLPGYFTGTGDIAAALSLAWLHRLHYSNDTIPLQSTMESNDEPNWEAYHTTSKAFYHVLSTMKAVLIKTTKKADKMIAMITPPVSECILSRARELSLVNCKKEIEEPPIGLLNPLIFKYWTIPI